MAKQKKTQVLMQPADFQSPLSDLVYRALVFARANGETPLYFVAGAQGGPWNASNALATAQKVHGGPCFYCRQTLKPGEGTIDHVEPQCAGGRDAIHNLVVACKPCNARKGHQIIELHNPEAGKQWLEAVLRQVQDRLSRLQ